MKIKDIITKDTVLLLEETSKESVLKRLIQCAFETGNVASLDELEKNVFYREELMSTGMGAGIAIPHNRYKGIKKPIMIVAIQPEGIPDYATLDDQEIKFVIMILVGKDQHKKHIQMMSQIVSLLKIPGVREKLLAVENSEEIYEIIMAAN